jgi:hypothetical protein
MSDIVAPHNPEHSGRVQAEHYRMKAARFHSMAEIEPLAALRRHLRALARQCEEMADRFANPEPRKYDGSGQVS